MPVTPDLTVVIVSWNVRELLRACLRSLVEGARDGATALTLEVIVVDNASHDGSVELVQAEFPAVRVVANRENRGFTGGNNDGLRISTGRYLMLLNPDTEVRPGALVRLCAYLDAHAEVGVVGPQLLNPDGSVQSSRRRFPTWVTGLFESTWLQAWAPRGVLDAYYVRERRDDEVCAVDWVVGAALMVRREIYAQVGGLDEGFFMYSEELDWCKRIRMAGWQVAYVPSAQIVHYEGKSSEQVTPARHIYFQTSKVRYFRKHHGFWQGESLRKALLILYAVQLVEESLKGLIGHKRALRQQRVQAYWRVLKTGLKAQRG